MTAIRPGGPEDAPALARMISDFNVEEGSPGRVGPGDVTELCFVEGALYQAQVAEAENALVGYALVTRYFDTDPCAWCSYMQDLYVAPAWRSRGVGRRLIASAARLAVGRGHAELLWHVRAHNQRGRAFYAAAGGREQTAVPVTLAGEALATLAKEA